jgi:Ketopantoate reductase PanE/ApbA C terminal
MTGVLVIDAGSVGCFVGCLTQLDGMPVQFVGRPRVLVGLRIGMPLKRHADLAQGRTTEIDALCGEVVRLASSLRRTAPLNARMQALIDAQPRRHRPDSPAELLHAQGRH